MQPVIRTSAPVILARASVTFALDLAICLLKPTH
jgi:hypothetical protein